MSNKIYRVMLIEPSPIVQCGIRTILQNNTQFQLAGTMNDLNRYEERLAAYRPDMVIVNPLLIDFHHRGTIKNLFPNVELVGLVYTFTDLTTTSQFRTVIGIYDSPEKIESKLQEVVSFVEQDDTNVDNGEELTDREKEILISVAKGMINKEIALQHNISIHTVISHRKNITRKTGIKSISGLTVYALLNNLIEQGDVQ